MKSKGHGGALLSEMLTAWYRTAEAECDKCRSTVFKCAPCTEALELGSHGFRESPAQCDLKSLMAAARAKQRREFCTCCGAEAWPCGA